MNDSSIIDLGTAVPTSGKSKRAEGEQSPLDPLSLRQCLALKATVFKIKIETTLNRVWFKIKETFNKVRTYLRAAAEWVRVQYHRIPISYTVKARIAQALSTMAFLVGIALQMVFIYVVFIWSLIAAIKLFGWD